MSWFTEENAVFYTAVVVSETSSHPSHLWNLKNINIVGWAGGVMYCIGASPPSHCSTCSSLRREKQLCTEQNEVRWEGWKSVILLLKGFHRPLYHLYMSLGVSTYLMPVSRTPDMHCHTSSRQSSGMALVWLWLTVAIVNSLLSISSFSWVSSNKSSSKFDIQFGSYVKPKFSTTVQCHMIS